MKSSYRLLGLSILAAVGILVYLGLKFLLWSDARVVEPEVPTLTKPVDPQATMFRTFWNRGDMDGVVGMFGGGPDPKSAKRLKDKTKKKWPDRVPDVDSFQVVPVAEDTARVFFVLRSDDMEPPIESVWVLREAGWTLKQLGL